LAELADGVPVVTDSPSRAQELLALGGARNALIWDVLELGTLLVPASPRDALERAAEFFGVVVNGSGPRRHAECVLLLFGLLVARRGQIEPQTLLHGVRLASGLDWPLRKLFTALEQQRALSPLEIGPLAAATPIGAWITQGAAPRRRRSDGLEAQG